MISDIWLAVSEAELLPGRDGKQGHDSVLSLLKSFLEHSPHVVVTRITVGARKCTHESGRSGERRGQGPL